MNTTNSINEMAEATIVRVKAPEAGACSLVSTIPGSSLALEFDPANASMSREGDNLVFTVDGEGMITISDYFAATDGHLGSFVLPDGSVASASEFFAGVPDILTEAGQQTSSSNGINEYSDAAGALIGGVDRLGSLGTDQWASGSEAAKLVHMMGDGPTDDAPEAGVTQTPVGPFVPHSYQARAVIYANDPSKNNTVTTQYLDGKGNPVQGDPNLSFLDGDDASFVIWSYDGSGNLVFTLTDEGKAFLAGGGSPEYIEALFRVTDRVTGESYVIQVVIPRDGHFDASDFAENGSRFGAPVGDNDLIHGEWHEGDADWPREYNSTSSNLDDSYTFNGLYEGTDIRTGYGNGSWGNDTVTINGDIENYGGTVNIVTGRGNDEISLYAMYAHEGGVNNIDTGREIGDRVDMTWKMHAEGTGNDAGETSRNSVITGDLTIDSGVNYGMYAVNTNQGENKGGNSAENYVDAAGDVTISAGQFGGWEASAMRADNQSRNSGHVSNTVRADGNVTLRMDDAVDGATQVSGMHAGTWCAKDHGTASNEIDAGGHVAIIVEGGGQAYGMFALNEAANTVRGGSVGIDVSGKGYVAGVQSSSKDSSGNDYWTTGGKNVIESSSITIDAQSSGGEAYAVATGKYGETEIKGLKDRSNTFEFEATGASAYGMASYDNGDLPSSSHGTDVTGGSKDDTITIRATSNGTSASDGYAIGMYAGSTGHNRIDTGAGFDTVVVEAKGTGNVMGMSAGSNKQAGKGWGGTDASNSIENAEKVTILAESKGGNAYGVFTNTGSLPQSEMDKLDPDYDTGFNKIILGDGGIGDREVNIAARALGTGADSGNAIAMSAYNQNSRAEWGYNLVEGNKLRANTMNIEAESRGGQATGLYAQGPASNTTYRTGNTITGGDRADTITVSVTGATRAIGMQAGDRPSLSGSPAMNEIDSGKGRDRIRIDATATGKDGEAIGLLAYSGGHNDLTAREGDVDINVIARSGDASGMTAMGEDAVNTVTALIVDVEVAASDGDAYGMRADQSDRAYFGGHNVVNGSEVSIMAMADGDGKAYGMFAHLAEDSYSWSEGGTNTIQAIAGKALTVIIMVEAGSADDAYAMFTKGDGQNSILGGDKGDLVDLTGRIEGNNLIDTGAGDDTISLNGRVDTSLIIRGGDGHDLLILMADDAESFTANYKDWLESLSDEQLRAMSIEEIWVNGEEGTDWLNDSAMDWFRDFVYSYNQITGNDVCPTADISLNADMVHMAAMFAMEQDGSHEADVWRNAQSGDLPGMPSVEFQDENGELSLGGLNAFLLFDDDACLSGLLSVLTDMPEQEGPVGHEVHDNLNQLGTQDTAGLISMDHGELPQFSADSGDALTLLLMSQSDVL